MRRPCSTTFFSSLKPSGRTAFRIKVLTTEIFQNPCKRKFGATKKKILPSKSPVNGSKFWPQLHQRRGRRRCWRRRQLRNHKQAVPAQIPPQRRRRQRFWRRRRRWLQGQRHWQRRWQRHWQRRRRQRRPSSGRQRASRGSGSSCGGGQDWLTLRQWPGSRMGWRPLGTCLACSDPILRHLLRMQQSVSDTSVLPPVTILARLNRCPARVFSNYSTV